MRALAALAVLTTHVAFQTGSDTGTALHRLWGRLDLSVAVFFALSGFLLWRSHALHARADRPGTARPARSYLRSRLVRIMPAYLLVVVSALVLLPGNAHTGPVTWLANLTLTQIYVPDTLTDGLTHAWSLAVEMAFYLVLPLLWTVMAPLRGGRSGRRIPVLLGAGVLSLGWAALPWHRIGVPEAVNDQILPPAFTSWFVAGMILAELAAAPPGRVAASVRGDRSRWIWWSLAALALAATTVPRWFHEGFVHPAPTEFAARVALGALLAFLLLAPVVLAPAHTEFAVLASVPMQALGRWSYGVFLWHVPMLYYAFQLVGVPMFSGHMAPVWAATVVVSIVVAAASYALVEEPARQALDRAEARRADSRAPGHAAASPAQTSPKTVAI